jgi:geranylgeranyl pyrophosphate synthase
MNGDGLSEDEFSAVATLIEQSGAIDESIEAAREYVDRAIRRLDSLPDREVASSLEAFANLALERTS